VDGRSPIPIQERYLRLLAALAAFAVLCLAADPTFFSILTKVSCGAQGCMGDVLHGDTYIFGGWSNQGSTTIDGNSVPGTIFGTFNDGETRSCIAVPAGGNVTVIKLTKIDVAVPSNGSLATVNCMAGAGLSGNVVWTPAPRGTCTVGVAHECSWKSLGITHVNGKLYLQVFRQESAIAYYGHDSTLLRSDDEGATWVNPTHVGGTPQANGDFPAGPGDPSYPAGMLWPDLPTAAGTRQPMARLGFVHYCQDESVDCPAIDNNQTYIYALATSGTFSSYVLARVAKSNLPHLKASEWEYYLCPDYDDEVCDGMQAENWTPNLAEATSFTEGTPGADAQTIWAPGLKQYVATGFDGQGHVFLSTAPHVWGPWKQQANLTPGNGTEVFNNLILPTYRSLDATHATVILANNSYVLDGSGTLYLYKLELRWRPVVPQQKRPF
jgi:hypothetical protein